VCGQALELWDHDRRVAQKMTCLRPDAFRPLPAYPGWTKYRANGRLSGGVQNRMFPCPTRNPAGSSFTTDALSSSARY
jgi:hypothetical protein